MGKDWKILKALTWNHGHQFKREKQLSASCLKNNWVTNIAETCPLCTHSHFIFKSVKENAELWLRLQQLVYHWFTYHIFITTLSRLGTNDNDGNILSYNDKVLVQIW